MLNGAFFIIFAVIVVAFVIIYSIDRYFAPAEQRRRIVLAAAQHATEELKTKILETLFPEKKQSGEKYDEDTTEPEEDISDGESVSGIKSVSNKDIVAMSKNDHAYETSNNSSQDDENVVDEETSTNSNNDTCAVCIEPLEKDDSIIVGYSCKHKFHRSCVITTWLKKRSDCPVCRIDMWSEEDYLKAKLKVLEENPDAVEKILQNRESNTSITPI